MCVCFYFSVVSLFSARWFLRFRFDDWFFPPNSRRNIAHWHCGFVMIVNKTQNCIRWYGNHCTQIERLTFIWFLCSLRIRYRIFFSMNETILLRASVHKKMVFCCPIFVCDVKIFRLFRRIWLKIEFDRDESTKRMLF